MLELYKKINKSIEYPKGARKILEGENPFLEGPCLLCLCPQSRDDKSIFGLTKMGIRMARVRTKGYNGAKISLDEVPVSFLTIKTIDRKNIEEDNVKDFIEKYFKPLFLDGNNLIKTKEMAMKSIRNLNIMSNCDSTKQAIDFIEGIEQVLIELGYNKSETEEILSQIFLLTFQTEKDLNNCKASVIDFHNISDKEVRINLNNINKEMLRNNINSKNGESVEISGKRIEVLIKGEDSHEVKNYIEYGDAMPVIVYNIMSSVLENSIDNYKDNRSKPLLIEELYNKAKIILERIENGEQKEELIEELDSSLDYGGKIKRLSERELRLIDSQEEAVEEYDRTSSNLRVVKSNEEILRKEKNDMLNTIKDVCTEGTELRILEASGWQLSSEQKDRIMNSETDKKTIDMQNKKIEKLQGMLDRTLKFATDVKKSIFGKFFFRKAIKELPEGNDNER